MGKTAPVPVFLKGVMVRTLDDINNRKTVLAYLESIGYELVLPPDKPKIGDEFLSGGDTWVTVDDKTYTKAPFGPNSYVVRRPSEHLKMTRFFFGTKK